MFNLNRQKLCVISSMSLFLLSDLTHIISQEISINNNDEIYRKQICSICKVEDDGSYKCTCFSTSNLECEMVQNFILCGKYNNGHNKVFEYCWDQQIQLSAITTVKDICYDSVYKLVWKPTILQCQSLLSKLKDKTITLKEAESIYQIEDFSLQLSALDTAIRQCYPSFKESLPPPKKWLPQTVAHIKLYHKIANNPKCTVAANVILKVQTSLKLKGNFKVVEDLARHVRM